MSADDISGMIAAHRDAIVAGVQERMMRDPTVVEMAAARGTHAGDLAANVVGFWLQGIQTDLSLGSTAAMEQSLAWLARMRAGQGPAFDDEMVASVFNDISNEIEARLTDPSLVQEYRDYHVRVLLLIAETFPGGDGT